MDVVYYETIIVGAGAAGLYCACSLDGGAESSALVLEKNKKAGRKLLMTGNGRCNVTHGGSIKEFMTHYADKGRRIRGILQRYNNRQLCDFLESIGVPLTEREDGKVFPASMASADVLNALLREIKRKGIAAEYESEVIRIEPFAGGEKASESRFTIYTPKKSYRCQNLVIATGGCSYAGTGSDGKMLNILSRDLNIDIEEPRPVLTPVYVEDYEFKDLSGVSFRNIEAYIETEDGKRLRGFAGDLLFTSKTLSGPAILNNSRYMRPGMILSVNFLTPADEPKITERFKRDFPGNGRSPQTYMSENLGLPKRFAQAIACKLSVSDRKVSQITGKQMRSLSEVLTGYKFKIRKLGGFSEAMATGGGVSLCHKTSAVMEHEVHKGLYFIGEAVDVDGDTGGYNLQFAYSSAKAAAHNISAGEFSRGTKK